MRILVTGGGGFLGAAAIRALIARGDTAIASLSAADWKKREPERVRHFPCHGTLPHARGAVDGDDHDRSAPSERINSTKPGKLVAMKAESSMRTGLSLASPMTIADMAMR